MPSRKQAVTFFLIIVALCSWHLDAGTNDGTLSRAMATSAIVETGSSEFTAHHTLTGDKAVVDGRYYTDKAPLPSWVLVPLWALARAVGANATTADGSSYAALLRLGGFIWGVLPFALIALILWRRSFEHPQLTGHRALTVLVPMLGSFLFVYSGSLYNHLPAALFVLLTTISIGKERFMIAGLWASAALLTDTASVVIIAVQGLQLLLSRPFGSSLRFATAYLVGIIITLVNNAVITGSAFTFPSAMAANYPHMTQSLGFRGFRLDALFGLTFSLYRGLFIYMPALVALLLVRPLKDARAWLTNPYLLPAIALILAYSLHSTWWGGWTYGPRYITCSAVLLLAFLLEHLRPSRIAVMAVLALGGIGLVLSVAAISTLGYSLPTGIAHPLSELVLPAVLNGQWTTNQLPVRFGVSPAVSSSLFIFVLATGLLLIHRIDRTAPHAPLPQS